MEKLQTVTLIGNWVVKYYGSWKCEIYYGTDIKETPRDH